MTRCKFKVVSITQTEGSKQRRDGDGKPVKSERGHDVYDPCVLTTVKMQAVYGGGDPAHENAKFWAATPSGSFEMSCVYADAVKDFELGKEVYLDLSLAVG